MPLILLLSAGATAFPYTDRQSGTLAKRLLNGATDGERSHDINLGKVALYQLSYCRIKGIQGNGNDGCAKGSFPLFFFNATTPTYEHRT